MKKWMLRWGAALMLCLSLAPFSVWAGEQPALTKRILTDAPGEELNLYGASAYYARGEDAPEGGYQRTEDRPWNGLVSDRMVSLLLTEGAPNDQSGLQKQCGVTKDEACYVTQIALWHFCGQEEAPAAKLFTKEQREYYQRLLDQCNTQAVSQALALSEIPQFRSEGIWQVTQELRILGGETATVRFKNMPYDVHVYSLDGERLEQVKSGQKFVLKTTQPVPSDFNLLAEVETAEPQLQVYQSETDPDIFLVTLGESRDAETVAQVFSVQSGNPAMRSEIPPTGDASVSWAAACFLGGIFLMLGRKWLSFAQKRCIKKVEQSSEM